MQKLLTILPLLCLVLTPVSCGFNLDLQALIAPFLNPSLEIVGSITKSTTFSEGNKLYFQKEKSDVTSESNLKGLCQALNFKLTEAERILVPAIAEMIKILDGCFKEHKVSLEEKDRASAVFSTILNNFVDRYLRDVVEIEYHGDIEKKVYFLEEGESRVVLGDYSLEIE